MGDNEDFLSGLGEHDEGDGEENEDEEGGGENMDREDYTTIHLKTEDDEDTKGATARIFQNRFEFTLSEISKFCRSQVQKGTADRFGIVLCNVESGKKNGVEVLLELNQPDVKFIQSLEKHAHSRSQAGGSAAPPPKSSEKLFDGQGRSHLQNGLDECGKILYQQKEEMRDAKKAIYILTWLDNPMGEDKTGAGGAQEGCLASVNDCKDNGIRVAVVPLAADPRDQVLPGPGSADSGGRRFYVGNFYDELAKKAYVPPAEGGGTESDAVRDTVERRIWHLEQEVMGLLNPRSIASLLWNVSASPKLQVAVKLYPLTMEAKAKGAVWVDQRNNKRVKSLTQRSSEDTGQLLMQAQIEKFFPYGKTEAVIDDKEMAKIKTMDIETGIHLLGFKPRAALRMEDNLRPPYFMYPDEKGLRGSTLTFTAFWESMLNNDKIAICTMRQRSNVAPRLVALVPGRERRDPDGTVLSPDGMHVVYLPFCDDIRTIPAHPAAATHDPVPADAVARAGEIMDHYQVDSSRACRDLQNPQLFRHYRFLEALSLGEVVNEEELAEVEASIMPDPEDYKDPDVVKLFDQFKAAIDPDFDAAVGPPDGRAGGGGAKRKREPKPDPVAPGDDLKDLVSSGKIQKLTVPVLKEHCKALGLPVGGNKADLITRISTRCAQP